MSKPKAAICVITTASLGLACGGVGNVEVIRNPPPPPPPKVEAAIKLLPDGTCTKQPIVDCPPESESLTHICAPPPAPKPTECPPILDTSIQHREGSCVLVQTFKCGPELVCPEPKETTEACPPDLKPGETFVQNHDMGCYISSDKSSRSAICPPSLDRPLPKNAQVYRNSLGECKASLPSGCPPDIPCNPPPPTLVKCPEDMKKE